MSHDHGARSRTASSRLLAVVVARRMRRQPTPEIQRRAARRRLGQRHNDHSPRRQVACHGHRTRPRAVVPRWHDARLLRPSPARLGRTDRSRHARERAPFLRIFRAGSTCGADRSSPTPTVRSCRSTAASCTGSIPTTCPSSSNAGSPPTAPTTACWRSSTAPWSPRIFVSKARAEPPSRGSIPARSNSSAGRSCSPRVDGPYRGRHSARRQRRRVRAGHRAPVAPTHRWRRAHRRRLAAAAYRNRLSDSFATACHGTCACRTDTAGQWIAAMSGRCAESTRPNRTAATEQPPGKDLSWRLPAPWAGAQRLLRCLARRPCRHRGDRTVLEPLAGASSLHRSMCQRPRWRSLGTASTVASPASRPPVTGPGGRLAPRRARRASNPLHSPSRVSSVINDFTNDGSDDLVVVDIATGELLDRVTTGSLVANGMFLTAGGNRDIFYCSTRASPAFAGHEQLGRAPFRDTFTELTSAHGPSGSRRSRYRRPVTAVWWGRRWSASRGTRIHQHPDRRSLPARPARPVPEVSDWFAANRPDYVFLVAGTVGGILANSTRPAEFIYDN